MRRSSAEALRCCTTQAAQTILRDWISAGGKAMFTHGAVAAGKEPCRGSRSYQASQSGPLVPQSGSSPSVQPPSNDRIPIIFMSYGAISRSSAKRYTAHTTKAVVIDCDC